MAAIVMGMQADNDDAPGSRQTTMEAREHRKRGEDEEEGGRERQNPWDRIGLEVGHGSNPLVLCAAPGRDL